MQQVEEIQRNLAAAGYIADIDLASIIHLTHVLQRPLLLEGDAGVGKTAVAVALSQMMQQDLIRLQCYDCLLYTSPSPRDATLSRMPSSA